MLAELNDANEMDTARSYSATNNKVNNNRSWPAGSFYRRKFKSRRRRINVLDRNQVNREQDYGIRYTVSDRSKNSKNYFKNLFERVPTNYFL